MIVYNKVNKYKVRVTKPPVCHCHCFGNTLLGCFKRVPFLTKCYFNFAASYKTASSFSKSASV